MFQNFLTPLSQLCNRHMGLAIAGGQCLIEVLCFVSSVVLADSSVLRNARHRQAQKRQTV